MKGKITMKSNYLIIHGSFASPFSNWIPWLRKEIENGGDRKRIHT